MKFPSLVSNFLSNPYSLVKHRYSGNRSFRPNSVSPQLRFAPTQSRFGSNQSRFARSFINANYGVVGAQICFIFYISFLNIPLEVAAGRFANISLRKRSVKNAAFYSGCQKGKRTITFDWLVCLSLARKILEIGPKGRKSSCRSASLVSSDKLVTLIVADSSNKRHMKTINFSIYLSCIKNWNHNNVLITGTFVILYSLKKT